MKLAIFFSATLGDYGPKSKHKREKKNLSKLDYRTVADFLHPHEK